MYRENLAVDSQGGFWHKDFGGYCNVNAAMETYDDFSWNYLDNNYILYLLKTSRMSLVCRTDIDA